MTTTTAPITVVHQPNHDWTITTPATLTDTEAADISFIADPSQVRLGAFVAVEDAEGTRIGEVSGATLQHRSFGPSYVHVDITLR